MITVKDLFFSYNKKPFLENINFEVAQGEIFGFLGPSGAGKSTLQKILTGLLTSYSGTTIVNRIEMKTHTNAFYENIGVDFEFPSLYEKLTARENLHLQYSRKHENYPVFYKLIAGEGLGFCSQRPCCLQKPALTPFRRRRVAFSSPARRVLTFESFASLVLK